MARHPPIGEIAERPRGAARARLAGKTRLAAIALGLSGASAIACSSGGSGGSAPPSGATTPIPGGEPTTQIEGPLHEIAFTGEEKSAHVVVGDDLAIYLGSVMFDCEPRAALGEAPIIREVTRWTLTPGFPTPLRTFAARFRAESPGAVRLAFACSQDGRNSKKGQHVADVQLTVLAPAQAEPFVEVHASGIPDPILASVKARAEKCFAAELAREPRARGALWAEFGITGDGARMVIQRATATGLAEPLSTCARAAVASAVPIPAPGGNGISGHCSLRFTMRPKAAAPK